MKTQYQNLMKAVLCVALIAFSMGLSATTTVKGNGNVISRDYNVTAFDEISTVLPATINYTVSDHYSCCVTLDENLFEYLDIYVNDDHLKLSLVKSFKQVNLKPTKFIIEISAPTLEEISLAGSGDFHFLSPLKTDKLEISSAGSGKVVFDKDANFRDFEMSIAGSGDLRFEKLVAEIVELSVAGSGSAIIKNGTVKTMEASIAGSGSILACCQMERLDYSIAGSGSISYYGDIEVNGKVVGTGKLKRIDSKKCKGICK